MSKDEFNQIVNEGILRGKNFMFVSVETEGAPAPEIVVNHSANFDRKIKHYNGKYNDDMELIKAKECGKIVRVTDVLMTSNLNDMSWFAY